MNYKFTKPTLLFFSAIFVFKLSAQETKSAAFSLQQAIDYAMKNSPNMLNAELDRQNSVYRKNEIAGSGLPQISGSVDLKDYFSLPTSLLPGIIVGQPAGTYVAAKFGTKYNSTVGLNFSQLIFSSDYIFGLRASKEFIGLSQINVNRSKNDLVAQVSKAYYTVLVSKERLKLFDANLSRLKKQMNDVSAANKEGLSEKIDVERLEVQYNNTMNEKAKTEKLVEFSKVMLKFQMGYKPGDEIELTDKLQNVDTQSQELSVGAVNSKLRPDVQALQANQALLDLDVKRRKYGYLPTIGAYGSYQYNAQRTQFNFLDFSNSSNPTLQWFNIGLVGATLNLNVFDGLQRHYQIQQAKMASQKNQNSIKNLELLADLEVNQAVVAYNNALVSLNIQKKNTELAQHVVDVTDKKYQAGVGSNLEVVTAEASLLEAQTNYYNAVFDMISAKIDYEKAMGTLVK